MSTGEIYALTAKEATVPAIDPWNNVVQEDLAPFIQFHGLQTTEEIQGFLDNEKLRPLAKSAVSGIGITDDVIGFLQNKPSSVVAISGFDTAGDLHFGNLLVLKQLMILGQKGWGINRHKESAG